MDRELEIALEAHQMVDQVYDRLCRDQACPASVTGYVWRVRKHLSDRVSETGLRFEQV